MTIDHITRDEARTAIERCAFTDADSGRTLVHCFMGSMGADWDAEDAVQLVDECKVADDVPQVAWGDHLLWGRCLGVLGQDGKIRWFDSVTP